MQRKLPRIKRQKIGDPVYSDVQEEEGIRPYCVDHSNEVQHCYNTEIVPMMMRVEMPGVWHRQKVHNEFEFGYSIGESQESVQTPRVASNILSGFLRRATTCNNKQPLPTRSLIYQLGTPSVQRFEDTLNSTKEIFFSSNFDIVYENCVAFRVQQYQYVYVVSRRCCQRIGTNATVTSYTEWKCKRKCAIGGTGEFIHLSTECIESDDKDITLYEAHSIIRRAIDIGVLPILPHEPHVHTALVITPRLIITWKQRNQYSWSTQLRLYMYQNLPCAGTKPPLVGIFQYLAAENVPHCMSELIRLSGFGTYQWRLETEFNRVITAAIFQAGFDAFCAIKGIILSQTHVLKKTISTDMERRLQKLVPYEYTSKFLQEWLQYKPMRRIRSIHADQVPSDLRTACHAMTPPGSVDIVLPLQQRPKDFTAPLYNKLHANQLVTIKVDGVEAFLVGTSHSLVICMGMGVVCCVATWSAQQPSPIPTPFIFEGEVFVDGLNKQLLHFNCYDCLMTPTQCCTDISYNKRIEIMRHILQIWKTDICLLPFHLCVASKPFLLLSMAPNSAIKSCLEWAEENKIPCDGLIISSASCNYWDNNKLKLKFLPTVDYYLHGKNKSLNANVYQLMLRVNATQLISVTKTRTDNHILPVCVTLPEYNTKNLDGRVVEISMERGSDNALHCNLSSIREVSKNPNYVQAAHDIVDNLMSVPYTDNLMDKLILQAGGIQSVMRHVREFKWQFFLDALSQASQSPFVLVDIGGGNGGDIHKWLSIESKNKSLREIMVVEPSMQAVQEYENRLRKLGIAHQHDRVWYTKRGCKLSILCGTMQSNMHVLNAYNIPIVFVFSFSITQVFTDIRQFDNFLRQFSRDENKIVILLHSYNDGKISGDKYTTHDVYWSDITNHNHTITISGTKLASGITETRMSAADLFEHACKSGWMVRVRTWPVAHCKLHWLLSSLCGLVMLCNPLPPAHRYHTQLQDTQLLANVRRFVIQSRQYYKTNFVLVYYRPSQHFFVYRTMTASLYRYLGCTTIKNDQKGAKGDEISTSDIVASTCLELNQHEWISEYPFLQSIGLRVTSLVTNLNYIIKYADGSSD